MDSEKKRFVAQLGDEFEFVLDERHDLRGNPVRPAACHPLLGQNAQVFTRRAPGRHEFARILIAQFIECEAATCGNPDAARQRRRRIDPLQTGAWPKIALMIRQQFTGAAPQRRPATYRVHGIGNRITLPTVHVHVTTGNERQFECRRNAFEPFTMRRVRAFVEQFERDPHACRERMIRRAISR